MVPVQRYLLAGPSPGPVDRYGTHGILIIDFYLSNGPFRFFRRDGFETNLVFFTAFRTLAILYCDAKWCYLAIAFPPPSHQLCHHLKIDKRKGLL